MFPLLNYINLNNINWGFVFAICVHVSGELFVTSSHETEFLLLWDPDHSFRRQCARPYYGPRWVVTFEGLDIRQIVSLSSRQVEPKNVQEFSSPMNKKFQRLLLSEILVVLAYKQLSFPTTTSSSTACTSFSSSKFGWWTSIIAYVTITIFIWTQYLLPLCFWTGLETYCFVVEHQLLNIYFCISKE